MALEWREILRISLEAQILKNPPAMQDIWVPFLSQEDPLEEEMQPTPVSLPGEARGQRSLAGCSPWGRKELDATEATQTFHFHFQNLKYPIKQYSLSCLPRKLT